MAKQQPQVQPQQPQQTERPPRLSHKAAAVKQEIDELEDDLAHASKRAQEMENRALVAESLVECLKSELQAVRQERDLNKELWTEVRTDLETSASIILKAMDRGATVTHRSRQEAFNAVEQALADAPLQPVPAFLTAGPRETNGAGS